MTDSGAERAARVEKLTKDICAYFAKHCGYFSPKFNSGDIVQMIQEAAIIREETGTQLEPMLQLLKDYGAGEWGDNDFDRWIDRKDALLREITLPAAPDEGGKR